MNGAGSRINTIWHLLMQLYYPSVLGSILYSLLQFLFQPENYIFDVGKLSLVLLCVAVVVHFSVDYIYVSLIENYPFQGFVTDFVIVGLLYNAFRVIDPTAGSQNLFVFFVSMMAIYLIFLPQEFRILRAYRTEGNLPFVRLHKHMIIHAFVSVAIFGVWLYFVTPRTLLLSALLVLGISVHYAYILVLRHNLERTASLEGNASL